MKSATASNKAESEAPSPLLVQYFRLKEQYADCLLFFRLGDFYELFFDDALIASRILDIVLTKRGQQYDGADIPMCGIPAHAYEAYLAKLIKSGHRIAVCEQLETPEEAKARAKAQKTKAIVTRDVVRIITPGTVTEETLLEAGTHYHLAAYADGAGTAAIAWLDLATAQPYVRDLMENELAAELARIEPRELLVSDRAATIPALQVYRACLRPVSGTPTNQAALRIAQRYGVQDITPYGDFSRSGLTALAMLLDYIDLTQRQTSAPLLPPITAQAQTTMALDAATRRNLELTRTLTGERSGSLLATIDRTVTAAGARMLASDIGAPLCDRKQIEKRQTLVGDFVINAKLRQSVRTALGQSPDIERALTRLALGRGGPRDLQAISKALEMADETRHALAGQSNTLSPALLELARSLPDVSVLADDLIRALCDDVPHLARDGGFIRPSYNPALAELLVLRDDSRRLIADLQSKYAAMTGIAALKIKHNNVFGYFIEATPVQADKLLTQTDVFIHRQTLAGAVRFTTTELAELARKVADAGDRALMLELRLFEDLTQKVVKASSGLRMLASLLSRLDVSAAQAELAVNENYACPILTDSDDFHITGGRHPVVEAALKRNGTAAFVPNNVTLEDKQKLWLLTGPNMAGKSTFLRQNALIAILAQAGGYVPAQAATLGIIDRLFSRVGAADDLARGQSTFMVEMVETATILHQATPRSLVILDEIGRGTATYDGLSIAWAALEYLATTTHCRALFATHYHELTALESKLPALACYTMDAREHAGELIFLHEVKKGTADRSYGIHVAKLAGLPHAVIIRAEQILATLEIGSASQSKERLAELPLFTAAPAKFAPSATLQRLAALDTDSLSPRDALDLLYELGRAAKTEVNKA